MNIINDKKMEARLPEGRKNLKRRWQGVQNITNMSYLSFITNNTGYDLMKHILFLKCN